MPETIVHTSEVATPEIQWGPCGQPCDSPCDDHSTNANADAGTNSWTQMLQSSLFNTLDVCFDDVHKEPKKILMVGGSRQLALAQHLALLLPAAEIHLVDPDAAVTKRAEEEICCRFKFATSPLEKLHYEDNQFDLTIAHNFFGYPKDWKPAMSELGRVTSGHLWLSVHRPLLAKMAGLMPGFKQAMAGMGTCTTHVRLPDNVEMLTHLLLYSKIETRLAPFPWTVYMNKMRSNTDREIRSLPSDDD